MPAWSRLLFSCLAIGAVLGCEKGTAPATAPVARTIKAVGGVGVVDLDSVAKQLGRDLEMNKLVQDELSSLNYNLNKFESSLKQLYDEKAERYGEGPTDEQQKQLTAMQERMSGQLLEARRKAERELAVYKQQLIDQFREQTRPVLREVAADRGLSIVVPKNNGLLLSIDPAVEITDDVAKKMVAMQSAPVPERTTKARKSARDTSTETSAR
jgi:Skp family chaperone for outer membrane proteins